MLEPKDSGTTQNWVCTANGTGTRQIQIAIAPHANVTPGGLIQFSGKTWRVYKYNAGTPQEMGFVFAVKMIRPSSIVLHPNLRSSSMCLACVHRVDVPSFARHVYYASAS